jgi:hypothetical protein
MVSIPEKVRRTAQDGDGYFAQKDISLLNLAADEIERMHLALSEILESDDLSYIKTRALVALPDNDDGNHTNRGITPTAA